MPVTPSYPGIYIQELPSSTHTITASPTNIAVFIGYTHPLKTPAANWGRPVQIFGFMDYQRQFGGFVRSAAFANAAGHFGDMATAVSQFFLNGGTNAYVVGIEAKAATSTASVTVGALTFSAREITDEVFTMSLTIRLISGTTQSDEIADIFVSYGPKSGGGTVNEVYRRVGLNATLADGTPDPNYILTRIGTSVAPVSSLVTVALGTPPVLYPAAATTLSFPSSLPSATSLFNAADFTAVMQQDTELDKLAIFNLMVIPGVTDTLVVSTALAFCEAKRAFMILDPPLTDSADGTDPAYPHKVQDTIGDPSMPHSKNGAFYFPYLKSPDPLTGAAANAATDKTNEVPPSPTVAGIFAATDLARGVWKAPAGFQATTANTTGVVDRGRMTDMRQGTLNPLGVNCLRDFPNIGTAVFGARTLVTVTDEQWRYVSVRRMALFLEQTLYANLGWVVFEPNDTPLWSAIEMSVGSFMLGLFRQGAFQGTTPSQAFSVQCNSQTTTQQDIDSGIVNIVVAFAPLKPAEFVVITIAQLAGQSASG